VEFLLIPWVETWRTCKNCRFLTRQVRSWYGWLSLSGACLFPPIDMLSEAQMARDAFKVDVRPLAEAESYFVRMRRESYHEWCPSISINSPIRGPPTFKPNPPQM
jgi:hypothetical protein